MDVWKLGYWSESGSQSPIEKWLNKLNSKHLERVLAKIGALRKYGYQLKLPHSKALGEGLFELREMEFGYRIYYCFNGYRVVVLLAAGDKTSQDKDIKIARKRLLSL